MTSSHSLDGLVQRMRVHSHLSSSDEAAVLAQPHAQGHAARGLLVWGRGGVAVRNWDRLEDVAEFDRRYLHLRTEPAFC